MGAKTARAVPRGRHGGHEIGHDLTIRIAPIQLVIFDCGGVLVDSEAISDRVLAELLSEQGLPTTSAGARKDYEAKRVEDIVQIAQRKLEESLPDGWEADFERRRGQAFIQDGLQAMPGAMDVVVGLRAAGIDVCVASQGKLAKIRFSLGLTNLLALFDENALFSAESMRRGKPHPDLFHFVAQRRDASVLDTVVVEDTPSGIKAAVDAKCGPSDLRATPTQKGCEALERKRSYARSRSCPSSSASELAHPDAPSHGYGATAMCAARTTARGEPRPPEPRLLLYAMVPPCRRPSDLLSRSQPTGVVLTLPPGGSTETDCAVGSA